MASAQETAVDRQEEKAVNEKRSCQFTEEQTRAKTVEILCQRGHGSAAVVVEGIDDLLRSWDGQDLQQAIDCLYGTLDDREYRTRVFGFVRHYVKDIIDRLKLAKGDLDVSLVLSGPWANFCRRLDKVYDKLGEVDTVPRLLHERCFVKAEKALEEVQNWRFASWALKAIERMLVSSEPNEISDLVKANAELAEAICGKKGCMAFSLIDALKNRAARAVRELEVRIEQRRAKSRADSVRREENRRSRIGMGPQGRSGESPPKYGNG